jgi:phenylacetate-CoA ligase
MHRMHEEHQNASDFNIQPKKHGIRARAEALAAEMNDRDRWSREQLLEYQAGRLREIIRYAVAHSPYYHRVIGDIGTGKIDLQQLPVLTKATLMTEFDQIVTDRRLRLVDAEEHLAGEKAAEAMFGEYRIVGSGGTSGRRGVVVYDQSAWDIAVAGLLRLLAIQEVPESARVLGIGAPTPLHMTNRLFAELRTRRNDVPQLAVTTPLSEMVDALNAYQPEVVITYPSVIRRLAEEQAAGRLKIAPWQFTSVAETLTPNVRELARDIWGAKVLNAYGSTEANLIGVECPWASGLHVLEDLVIVEVVDEHNQPVPPGGTGHKLLVTNLFNRALPFIRYELSDLVTVAEEPCGCGRPHLRLASIQGRREDMVSLPAANGGKVEVHAFLLGETLLHIPNVRQYQLSPQPRGLLVRVVLRSSASKDKVVRLARQAILEELNKIGAAVSILDVRAVDDIGRVGGGAKEKLVTMSA